jgi:hypothetical protein
MTKLKASFEQATRMGVPPGERRARARQHEANQIIDVNPTDELPSRAAHEAAGEIRERPLRSAIRARAMRTRRARSIVNPIAPGTLVATRALRITCGARASDKIFIIGTQSDLI